ncbi:DUF4189 domain-containing protein [Nocardia goodfellowii]|uniref:DUF4189 domain-containing protein n=1 Tax=Nocardia goodfellowii TaxID=882446 RepID=A0ABS4QND1_9NOCA|nr:DUF4189 domain-containing protein [Nocardia goodfellowii]MBP2193216.1 hypothetical protein [Nocardia goodfellowii]
MRFIGKAAFAFAALGLAGGSVTGAGSAHADNPADEPGLFGAIAFSEQNWSYGTSVDADSVKTAIDEALDSCGWDGASDCAVVVTWADGCGALVYVDNDSMYGYGSGAGPDRSSALAAAHASLGRYYPQALLANVGSADRAGTGISEVICTANAQR